MDINYFLVRNSGKRENCCYIDYIGQYKLSEISEQTRIDIKKLTDIYIKNGGVLEPELDVYYFNSIESAKEAIRQISASIKAAYKGRSVFLTEREINTIRRALISDGAVALDIGSKIKDSILEKLNG